jgi:hypothetical protein
MQSEFKLGDSNRHDVTSLFPPLLLSPGCFFRVTHTALSPITFISCIPASASTSLFYNNLSLKVATALALTVVHCSHIMLAH